MPEQTKHISSSFDAALYVLKNDVLMMSSLTDRIFQEAFEAFISRNSELCDHVIAEGEEIDKLVKQVDHDGVSLLIRFQPVASDMRNVVCAVKVSKNLKGVGDESITIARRAKSLNSRPPPGEVGFLKSPHELALAIFRDSVRAFADNDSELAQTIKLRNKELDTVTSDLNEKLVARASTDRESLLNYLDLIFVVCALERIGDCATNLAEDAFWRDPAADGQRTYGATGSRIL